MAGAAPGQSDAGEELRPGTRRPGAVAPVPPGRRAERRAIVSESRVRVSDEAEEVPVRDGEVGEADVFGESEEPGEAGELGGTGETGDTALADDAASGAAPAGDDTGAAVDGTGAA